MWVRAKILNLGHEHACSNKTIGSFYSGSIECLKFGMIYLDTYEIPVIEMIAYVSLSNVYLNGFGSGDENTQQSI